MKRPAPWPAPCLFGLALAACQPPSPASLQGYVETEMLELGAASAGRLEALPVVQGAQVSAGSLLFRLEAERERAQLMEADAALAAAEARLADLAKGRRSEELAVIEAQLAQARTAQALAARQLERTAILHAKRLASPEAVDESRSREQQARQRLDELAASLASARLAARDDSLRQAEAEREAARARQAQAQWQLTQRELKAPLAGVVQELLFRPGEFVPAGAPVLRLLPPEHIKVRFYIPEPELPRYRLGQKLSLSCDGCGAPLPVTLRYVSSEAQYTPPVIYSKENRAKFVYLAEAWPEPGQATRLRPGQPVDLSAVRGDD
ncbi:MAG: HlyD family efflux transporter periplasmic adaptor subunit [Gammaproteobacteria bacterium]|nr:HlyD family efflux transporter periplasmic adaptor subunit [Gammaproteobacteria bacterium]